MGLVTLCLSDTHDNCPCSKTAKAWMSAFHVERDTIGDLLFNAGEAKAVLREVDFHTWWFYDLRIIDFFSITPRLSLFC